MGAAADNAASVSVAGAGSASTSGQGPSELGPAEPEPPAAATLPLEWGLRMLQRPAPAMRTAAEPSPESRPPAVTSPALPATAQRSMQSAAASMSPMVSTAMPATAQHGMQSTAAGGQNGASCAPQPGASGDIIQPADDLEALLDRLQLSSGRKIAAANVSSGPAAGCITAGLCLLLVALIL